MSDNEIGVTVSGNIDDVMGAIGDLISELQGITDKIVDLVVNVDDSQLINVNASTDEVTESLTEASGAASGLDSALNEIDTTQLDAAKESADGLSESLSGAGSGAESTSSSGGGGSDAASSVEEDLLGGVAGAVAIGGVTAILDQGMEAAGGYADSWARMASVMGSSSEQVQAQWGSAVSQMGTNTGRRAGDIRNYLIQMGIAGVSSQSTLIDMFTGVSGAAFATGTSVETITNAMRRVISTGTLGARQLMSMGLSEQDVMNATGLTLDQVNEKLKDMDSNQRAAYLGSIINAKYAGQANEEYKSSWDHTKDAMGAAFDMMWRIFGELLQPVILPVLETITSLIKDLATWVNGLSAEQKGLLGQVILLGAGLIAFLGVIGLVGGAITLFTMAVAAPIMPLVIIIGLMGLLVIAFMHAYNTNENFRNSVDGVWNALSGFGGWLEGGFKGIIDGVGAAWTNFITTLQNGVQWIIDLPGNMYKWAVDAMTRFVDGIKQGIKPVTDALDGIKRLFPQSPPKEGPLADITPDKMTSWMSTIAGAGMDVMSNFNLGSVGMPNIPQLPTGGGNPSIQFTGDIHVPEGADPVAVGRGLGQGAYEGWASRVATQANNAGVSVVNMQR